MTFYASGRLYRTDWFRFQVQTSGGEIVRLEPVNMAAQRVRVLQGGSQTRQEMVKDVVGVAAEAN